MAGRGALRAASGASRIRRLDLGIEKYAFRFVFLLGGVRLFEIRSRANPRFVFDRAPSLRRGSALQNGHRAIAGGVVSRVLVEARKCFLETGRRAVASVFRCRNGRGIVYRLGRAQFRRRAGCGLSIVDLATLFDRGPRFLVLPVQADLAATPDFYLSALANRRGRLVAILISNRGFNRSRRLVENARPWTTRGDVDLCRSPCSSARVHQLACIGPLTLAAAGISLGLDTLEVNQKFFRRTIYAALLIALGFLTWQQSRQYIDIETIWRTTIERNPGAWMAYSNLGSFLIARGDTNDAIADFRKALELWPDQSKDHNNLGKALAQEGRMAEAMAEFQTASTISPNDPDAESNLGAALLEQGKSEEAISHLRQAVEKFPRHAQARVNLGNALLQTGNADGAIAEYEKTLELPFDHAESEYSIASALRQKGDLESAIIHYRKALELRPDYANAHNNLGNALRQQGQIKDAVSEYEAALKSDSGFVLAQNNLAWLLATAADPALRNGAKAVELAEKAVIATGGNDPVMLHTLAAAYAEDGQFGKAVAAAKDALDLAEANGIPALADSLRSKLVLYQSRTPYHETNPSR